MRTGVWAMWNPSIQNWRKFHDSIKNCGGDFEVGPFPNFRTSMKLTFTLNLGQGHTVVHHSLTSTYTPSFIKIERKILFRVRRLSRPNFEVTWHRNRNRYRKSGLTTFRYCPLVSKTGDSSKIPSKMVEEIDFEIGPFLNFGTPVTLTLTLNLGQGHTVVHHLSSSTYLPSFIKIGRKKLFSCQAAVETQLRSHVTPEPEPISKIWPDQI
jgi:hypothetical protein